MRVKKINIYRNITYFFIFFPYLSLGLPINSDMQPFAGALAAFYILYHLRDIVFPRSAWVLLFFSAFFLSTSIFLGESNRVIFKIFAYPYAFILYVFIYNTLSFEVLKKVKQFAWVYISICLFQYLAPGLYLATFGRLVRAVNVPELSGMRGVSALTTEPSFTAYILFVFFIILTYLKRSEDQQQGVDKLVKVGILGGVALTKAATGYMMFFALFMYEAIKKITFFRVLLFIAILAIAYGIVIYLELEDVRSVKLILMLIQSPEKVLYESSLFVRVYSLTAGFIALIENPFGHALGSTSIAELEAIAQHLFYGLTLPDYFGYVGIGVNMPSTLGMGLFLYGWFYLIFYLMLFVPIFKNRKAPLIVHGLIFAFTVQSFSFAFPYLWLMVVMVERNFWSVDNLTSPLDDKKNEGP